MAESEVSLEELRDQLLRARAEVENQRKRSEKAVSEAIVYGQAAVLERLLPLWDQLMAASGQMNGTDLKTKEGFDMVVKNMEKLFESFGLNKVKALQGNLYDPQWHEVLRVEESDQKEGEIMSVVQDGFMMAGRLLRPARVIVSKHKGG